MALKTGGPGGTTTIAEVAGRIAVGCMAAAFVIACLCLASACAADRMGGPDDEAAVSGASGDAQADEASDATSDATGDADGEDESKTASLEGVGEFTYIEHAQLRTDAGEYVFGDVAEHDATGVLYYRSKSGDLTMLVDPSGYPLTADSLVDAEADE